MLQKLAILSLLALPALITAAPAPTIAEAQTFMDRAEAELMKMGILQSRAQGIRVTNVADD